MKKKHIMKGGGCDLCGGFDLLCRLCEPWCPRNWGKGYGGRMGDEFFNIISHENNSVFYIKCKKCQRDYFISKGIIIKGEYFEEDFDKCKNGSCHPSNNVTGVPGFSMLSKYFTINKNRNRMNIVLGEGGSGKVLLGTATCSFEGKGLYEGDKVAIKEIDRENEYLSLCNLESEIELLRELKHDNIVKLYVTYTKGTYTYLVMEYLGSYRELYYVMKHTWTPVLFNPKLNNLSEKRISVLRQVGLALQYMHNKGVIYRDLKEENIMYDESANKVKILDFGLSIKAQNDNRYAGTYDYMSPEMLKGKKYTNKIDIWAFGILVYRIFTGMDVFTLTVWEHSKHSKQRKLRFFEKTLRENLIHLIDITLVENPYDRASIDQVLELSIFSSYTK